MSTTVQLADRSVFANGLLASLRVLKVLIMVVRGLWLARMPYASWIPAKREAAILAWSQQMLQCLDIELVVHGAARPGPKLVVANHVSWLDIVVINAAVPSRFVSKAEVQQWPLVGRIVTAAGTLYLQRERRRDAMRVIGLVSQALQAGDTVALFPEGTTGSGHKLLPFHANFLQAAIDAGEPVQPMALAYSEPGYAVSPSVEFVGETTLMQSLWRVLTARGLKVELSILPLQAANHADRRALAALLETQIEERLARRG